MNECMDGSGHRYGPASHFFVHFHASQKQKTKTKTSNVSLPLEMNLKLARL